MHIKRLAGGIIIHHVLASLDVKAPSVVMEVKLLTFGVRHNLHPITPSPSIRNEVESSMQNACIRLEDMFMEICYLDRLNIVCRGSNHVRSTLFDGPSNFILAFAQMNEL
jgi:hypothetical protein